MQLEGAAALTRGNWRAYDQFATMVPLRPRPRIGLLKTALGAVALLADRGLTALTLFALGVKSQDVVPSIQLEEADGCETVSSNQEDRVDTHKNAPMTPAGRLRMVQAVMAGEPMR